MTMDRKTWNLIARHVKRLEHIALTTADGERREEAIRSLAAIVLLAEGQQPPDGPGDGIDAPNVVRLDMIAALRRAA